LVSGRQYGNALLGVRHQEEEYLLLKIVSHCHRTWGEGHSMTSWGVGGSVWLQTAGPKSIHIQEMVGPAYCVALPTANAGQYANSHCNRCCSGLPVSSGI